MESWTVDVAVGGRLSDEVIPIEHQKKYCVIEQKVCMWCKGLYFGYSYILVDVQTEIDYNQLVEHVV